MISPFKYLLLAFVFVVATACGSNMEFGRASKKSLSTQSTADPSSEIRENEVRLPEGEKAPEGRNPSNEQEESNKEPAEGEEGQEEGEEENEEEENEGGETTDPYRTIVQTFQQDPESAAVDILFIVDNSTSMYDDQEKLGEKFPSFLDSLENIDFQIGVTTTDVSSPYWNQEGKLLEVTGGSPGEKILKPGTNQLYDKFLNTVVRPESLNCDYNCPSASEKPLLASMMAVDKKDSDNAGFFRDHAELAVVIISDEDESGAPPRRPVDVNAHIQAALGSEKQFRFYGIIIEPGSEQCRSSNSQGDYGDLIDEMVQLTQGLTRSICSSDFSPLLSDIGQDIQKLANSYELSHVPTGEVSIRFSPDFSTDWVLEGKTVTFAVAPPSGTFIEVSYKIPKE